MNLRSFTSFILLASSVLLVSCLTIPQINSWLDAQKGTPTINVSGGWDAGSVFGGGWGGASMYQSGNEIVGTIGLYNIRGVVNGDNIYLAFTSGAKVYYTALLKPSRDGVLEGVVAEAAIVNTDKARDAVKYPIFMKKYGPPEKK